jgi:hypothetical protein
MSKSFVDFPERADFEAFDRPKYLKFIEGYPSVVRILDNKAQHLRKHWINKLRTSILCLGTETCPICINNAGIRAENPKNFRSIRGYIPIQNRYVVNVLDRTPVVVDPDPEHSEEYPSKQGDFPAVSSDGQRSLVGIEPQPSNTIKLLERGRTLFEQFLALHQETGEFDDDENLVSGGITSFDLKLVTMGEGREKVVSPIALMQNNDDVVPILDKLELAPHVLSALGLLLTPEEVEQVAYGGATIGDIFTKRRSNEETEVNQEVLDDAESKVAGLFDKDDTEEELVSY